MSFTRIIVRSMVVLGALAVAGAGFAQSTTADQTATTTVTAVNDLQITAGATLEFTPTIGTADSDATTALSFESNDGLTYNVSVVADAGWAFTPPTGVTVVANSYPVLRFVTATSTAGSAVTTAGELISSANTPAAAVDVVTGIVNAAGTASVTLEVSISQTVVAGSYAAGLTYTLATP